MIAQRDKDYETINDLRELFELKIIEANNASENSEAWKHSYNQLKESQENANSELLINLRRELDLTASNYADVAHRLNEVKKDLETSQANLIESRRTAKIYKNSVDLERSRAECYRDSLKIVCKKSEL